MKISRGSVRGAALVAVAGAGVLAGAWAFEGRAVEPREGSPGKTARTESASSVDVVQGNILVGGAAAPAGSVDVGIGPSVAGSYVIDQNIGALVRVRDARAAGLQARIAAAEAESARLADEARRLAADAKGRSSPEFARIREQLQVQVDLAFEARQQSQKLEVDELRERLTRIERQLINRQRLRKEVVARRVNELLDPDLQWDATPPTAHEIFGDLGAGGAPPATIVVGRAEPAAPAAPTFSPGVMATPQGVVMLSPTQGIGPPPPGVVIQAVEPDPNLNLEVTSLDVTRWAQHRAIVESQLRDPARRGAGELPQSPAEAARHLKVQAEEMRALQANAVKRAEEELTRARAGAAEAEAAAGAQPGENSTKAMLEARLRLLEATRRLEETFSVLRLIDRVIAPDANPAPASPTAPATPAPPAAPVAPAAPAPSAPPAAPSGGGAPAASPSSDADGPRAPERK